MKRFSQQFNTAAKRVSMTKAESRELKERLVSYMEYHPLPKTAQQPIAPKAIASEPFWVLQFNTIRTRAYASMFALLALIIVPFAAEQSVPGDVLYPVKVRFNEEIRSSLSVSVYQQVEWETRRVERRLAEARLLATEGKLTPEIEDEVAAAVKSHSSAAQAGLAKLRETDRDEAAIAELSFASSLEVESEVLESEAERQQAAGASTTHTIAAAVADVRASVASPETTDVSFERLLARVEDETTHASELLLSVNGEVSEQERDDIDRRLADISRKIDLALAAYATSSESTTAMVTDDTAGSSTLSAALHDGRDEALAKQYLRDALRDAQKLVRFMTDIDVKNTVSVDELVPVTPTDGERSAAVQQQLNSLEHDLTTLTSKNITDEKGQFSVARIAELVDTATAALTAENITAAEAAVAEAMAIATDLLRRTADLPSTPVVPSAATSTPPDTAETATSTATSSEAAPPAESSESPQP